MKTITDFKLEEFFIICRPRLIFFSSFLVALIYLFIPITNFWVYNLVKNQIWDVVSLFVFAEVFYSTMPDCNEIIYSVAYILGLLAPTIIFSIAYSMDVKNNAILNLFAPCAGAYLVVLMYLLDVLLRDCQPTTNTTNVATPSSNHAERHTATFSTMSDLTTSTPDHSKDGNPTIKSRTTEFGVTAIDIFNACIYRPTVVIINRMGSVSTIENPINDIEMRKSSAGRGRDDVSISSQSPSEVSPKREIPSKDSREDSVNNGGVPISRWRQAWLKATTRSLSKASISDHSDANHDQSWIATHLYLPRQVYDYVLQLPRGKVKRGTNRKWIWFVTTCYVLSIQAFYFFLNFFTDSFRKVPVDDNFQRIRLFVVYIIVCMILKTIIKRLGMHLDCLKENTSSLFFIGEIVGLMFYFTFYRVLFESIVVWWEFVVFQVLHVISEWILYPLRASNYFFEQQREAMKYLPWKKKTQEDAKGFELITIGYEDWLDFVCLDFGLRVFIEITSGISMLLFFLLIDYLPYAHYELKETSGSDIGVTTLFIALAVVIELISAFLMNHYFFIPKNKHIRKVVDNSFRNYKFGFLVFVVCAMELINPLDAFIDAPYFS